MLASTMQGAHPMITARIVAQLLSCVEVTQAEGMINDSPSNDLLAVLTLTRLSE